MEVQGNTADIRHLGMLQENAHLHTNTLQEQLTAALSEIREIKEQQAAFDRRLMGAKISEAESSSKRNPRRK